MNHEEREHRSAPVLCKEDCAVRRKLAALYGCEVVELVDSHEALRAERDELQRRVPPYEATAYIKLLETERDAALAEVARLKALMAPVGVAEDALRNDGNADMWGSNEERAHGLLLDECIKVAKEVQP